jgi:hypothetical protein
MAVPSGSGVVTFYNERAPDRIPSIGPDNLPRWVTIERSGAVLSVSSRVLTRLLTVETLSLGRAAAGVSMVSAPRMLPMSLGVDSASAARMSWVTQMLGAREVALGLGTWLALRKDDARGARLWLCAGLLSDAVDALAVGTAVARGRVSKPAGAAVVAIAGGAVYTQASALSESTGRS